MQSAGGSHNWALKLYQENALENKVICENITTKQGGSVTCLMGK